MNTQPIPYYKKKHIARTQGLPEKCLFRCFSPKIEEIAADEPLIIVGMDSGVSNNAFCSIRLVQDPVTKAIIDFEYEDCYYFAEQMEYLKFQIDKQFFLVEQYFNLFSRRLVHSLVYEVLPITNIKDNTVLKGVLDAQATTTLISAQAYSLGHHYTPAPATSIKKCLTDNGSATKEDMCKAAYALTGDERMLVNDHLADAFGDCFFGFIEALKADCVYYSVPVPEKYLSLCSWNFDTMPKAPWEK